MDAIAAIAFYALEAARWSAFAAGSFFVLIGSIGLLRLPGFFPRLHAAGLTDTLGAELILISLMISAGWSLLTLKLALIGLALLICTPTATHALACSGYVAGLGRED